MEPEDGLLFICNVDDDTNVTEHSGTTIGFVQKAPASVRRSK
jgi:hypothetical protein